MPGEDVLLLWPAVTLLGFLLLAALVVALGRGSTARYEFERNGVQVQQRATVSAPAATGARVPAGPRPAESSAPAAAPVADPAADTMADTMADPAAREARAGRSAAVGVATHPAGKRIGEPGSAPAWWLVDGDEPGDQAVAGPFPDRVEADWALLSLGLAEPTRVVYGSQRTDGTVVRRQLPSERAWLADLGHQLDRLGDDWDELVTDDDALTTLVVEVAAALVEAGLPLHDCAGRASAGGVCLSPGPALAGVLVTWHQHDRMSVQQVRGTAMEAAVQRTMSAAVADLLRTVGFEVEPFGSSGCWMVTPAPR